MNLLSRRDFIKTTATSLALLNGCAWIANPLRAWAEDAAPAREFWVLCDTHKITDPAAYPQKTGPGSVNALDVASGESFKIDIPFFGHTATQNPNHPHQVMTFEKWGRRGTLVDLKEKAIVTSVEPEEGFLFFGHAAFISGNSAFLTTEDSYDNAGGHLTLRDPVTLKPIQKISSYGIRPHECRTIDQGRTILVVNEGLGKTLPCVSWVDVASGKLLHQVELRFDAGTLFGHVDMAPDGWLCASGFRQPSTLTGSCRIAFISPEGKVMRPRMPQPVAAAMKGEGLSIAFLGDSGLVAITVPESDMVAVFNYKTQALAVAVDIVHAKGALADLKASKDRPAMIVSSGKKQDLEKVVLEAPYDKPSISVIDAGFGGRGSHLARIYI